MSIAAANNREPKPFGQRQDASILGPGAVAVQFEGMDAIAMAPKKGQEHGVMPELTDAGEIPVRMIEDDKRFRTLAQRVQELAERVCLSGGEGRERALGLVDTRGRDAVHAEVEHGLLERDRPLERERNVGVSAGPERSGALERVVVGERHERHCIEAAFDLLTLGLDHRRRRQRVAHASTRTLASMASLPNRSFSSR